MNLQLDFVANFIKAYCKVFIATYTWSFFGFLIPNLEFNSFLLPESANHKSIVLILIGSFIFTILGYCFNLLAVYKIFCICFIRWMTFVRNFGLFDLPIENMSNSELMVMFMPLIFIMNAFEKEISFAIAMGDLIDRIYLAIRRIYTIFIRKENKAIEKVYKKNIVNTSDFVYNRQNKEIKSAVIDVVIGLISYPIFLILYWLIVGIVSFLSIEYLGIWTLNFPAFFLFACTYITAICLKH